MFKTYTTLTLGLLLTSSGAYADHLDADGILRNDDGSIHFMNQYAAMDACPEGTHLLTAREQAEESQASGAQGILEVSQVNPDAVPKGYYKISAINPDGFKDEFYFSYNNYRRPAGDLGNNWFWSSSVGSDVSVNAWAFYGAGGDVYYVVGRHSVSAVQCARDDSRPSRID